MDNLVRILLGFMLATSSIYSVVLFNDFSDPDMNDTQEEILFAGA